MKSRRIILAYLKGSRRGKAANRVERETMRDAFLAEALSGYEKYDGNHVRTIKRLRRAIKMQTSACRRIARWMVTVMNHTNYINVVEREWIDLIFEGKNRMYGAYALRKYSARRHLLAYALTAACIAIFLLFPSMLKWLAPDYRENTDMIAVAMSKIKFDMPEEITEPQFEIPPPPQLKRSIKFTALRVEDDIKVCEDLTFSDEFARADAVISTFDIYGSGCDIPDIEEQKIVLDVAKEELYIGTADQSPEFPGGVNAMNIWLMQEIKYPQSAIEAGITGLVIVQFTVWKDGNIRDIDVLQSVDTSFEKEALRVISKMPKWIPGKQGGRAVNVRYTLPIVFSMKIN